LNLDGFAKSSSAAYFYVRLIPQDSRALHLKLFTVPSTLTTFCEGINLISEAVYDIRALSIGS